MDRIAKEREIADRLRAGQTMTIEELVREAAKLPGWFLTTKNAIRRRGPNGALQCPITAVAFVWTGNYYPVRDSILVAARAIGLPYGHAVAVAEAAGPWCTVFDSEWRYQLERYLLGKRYV
jgi:hypothetical protein